MTSNFSASVKKFYWKLLSLRSAENWKSLNGRLNRRVKIVAAYVWRRLLIKTKFIAITGSVGKTTTKEFLADILNQQYPTIRNPGNWGGRFGGIEDTILKARPWDRFVVVELGIEKAGQMRSYARLVKPDIALLLNVKRCHTNEFKTLDAIAAEKAQLLYGLKRNGCAIVNQDNPYIARIASNLNRKVIRFGSETGVDYQLQKAVSSWPDRLAVDIKANEKIHRIASQLVGTHWAPTIAASFATATECSVPTKGIIEATGKIAPFWARMQPITLPESGATILREDWNGSFDTFEAAIKVMEDAEAIRKIVIFSDFSDTNKTLRSRANLLGRVAARISDVAVFVGDYADRSANAAISEGLDSGSVYGFSSISAAVDFLRGELKKGDLVLIKGQANQHLSRVYLGLLGPVECNKLRCPKQVLCDNCSELGFKWRPELKEYMAAPGSYF